MRQPREGVKAKNEKQWTRAHARVGPRFSAVLLHRSPAGQRRRNRSRIAKRKRRTASNSRSRFSSPDGEFRVIHSSQQTVALHVGVEFLHEFVCDFIEFGVFQMSQPHSDKRANVKKKKCNRCFFMVGMVYKLNKDSSSSKRSEWAVGALRKRCLCTVQDAIPLSERTSLHFFNIVKAPIVYFCIMRNSIDSYHRPCFLRSVS